MALRVRHADRSTASEIVAVRALRKKLVAATTVAGVMTSSYSPRLPPFHCYLQLTLVLTPHIPSPIFSPPTDDISLQFLACPQSEAQHQPSSIPANFLSTHAVYGSNRTKTHHSSLKLRFDLSQHAPFFIFVSANSKKDSHYKPIRVYTRDLRCKQTTTRQDLDMTTLTVYPDSSAPLCWIHPDNRKPA